MQMKNNYILIGVLIVFLLISSVLAQVDREIDITTPPEPKIPSPSDSMFLGELLSILLSTLFFLGFLIIIGFAVRDLWNKKIGVREFFKFSKLKFILLLLPILFNSSLLLRKPLMIFGFVFFIVFYYIFISILYWMYGKIFPINFNQFSRIKKILAWCLIVLLVVYFLMGFLVIVKGLAIPKPYVLMKTGEWNVFGGVYENVPHHRYAIGWEGIGALNYMDISIVNSKNRGDLVDCYGIKTNEIYETTKGDRTYSNCYLGFYIEFQEFSPGHILVF